jgi:hypothetical protein
MPWADVNHNGRVADAHIDPHGTLLNTRWNDKLL